MNKTDKKYVGGKEASKILGVHQRTLMNWDKQGLIKTIRNVKGGKRFYNIVDYLKEHECNHNEECLKKLEDIGKTKEKLNISYVRVSSFGQKDDLERQKKYIKEKYPDYIMIEDIGSGVNLNRKGLRKIIDLAINGKINKVVVAYKDRLTRFGFELIEDLIKKYSNGEIIIINKKDDLEPEEELIKDVMQIMNVFIAKMNGLRKYKKNHQI